ncbi:glycine zipper 2TM domain-containing protein [uncultured Sphingomonas sp.]|uniref:glycine zipper 2TM domain-containing protein n=1 Tax=uncultured Sphingomonas sp. TaxID=158754 RepID=UPI002591167F|nr:glycine zipper 2TM domain-containing protein [uncultured Sphingomonas sp.]
MKNALLSALMLATVTAPLAVAPADAQRRDRDYRWHGEDRNWNPSDNYREGRYRERRLGRNDRIYRGQDGRTYCRRNDGTTGLVVGGVGGAVLGNVLGGGLLGTLAGGAGGALLGREVDRGKVRCR